MNIDGAAFLTLVMSATCLWAFRARLLVVDPVLTFMLPMASQTAPRARHSKFDYSTVSVLDVLGTVQQHLWAPRCTDWKLVLLPSLRREHTVRARHCFEASSLKRRSPINQPTDFFGRLSGRAPDEHSSLQQS